ncbi:MULTISPECIES: tape measure protein [Pseudomonadaceae]|uniref:Putative tail protein n=1 Tax=viral metagenome TaxID=1070528 RepID=A0A6H1ZKX9_9ZZZZ|nr:MULTISPECIES: tape measure protein [Pseudomonadaceae]
MAKVKTQIVIEGKNDTRKMFRELNDDLESMNSKISTAGRALVGAFSLSFASGIVRSIAAASDSVGLMEARLKLATSSQEEFNTAQTELRRIAIATQSPLESLATLYQRISRPLKEAGRSQADILKVTEAVATSFRVSGASAQEAENGVIQFAQALGSGALRGEEFNSVAEQAPRLMQALADSIGVPTGALKDMAAQGQLTADVVAAALVAQLDTLRTEAASLPETVGGAMTNLSDRWNEAIAQADVSKLIEAINELADTVTDPAVVKGLTDIASAMATLAGWTVTAATEFTVFADKVAFTAAQLSTGSEEAAKQVAELEKLKRTLQEVNAARTGSSFFGSATVPLLMKFFAPEQLDAWAKELEGKINAFEQQLFGIAQGEGVQESNIIGQLEDIRDKDIESRNTYIAELKTQQDRMVQAAADAGKKLVAAEKEATADLEKVRADRLKIEERYQEALAGMNAGGDASYGAAQSLKVGARQALQAGDIQGAQAQAQAALKMLQDLAAAGESTYGFAGFIGELRDIELAANDLEQTNAEQKIEAIKAEMISLKSQAAALQDMPVSVKMDDAALAGVKAQLDALAATPIIVQVGAQYDFSQPYTLQDPGPTPPGYATGGLLQGPGTGTSDSILMYGSNGEFMIQAAAVRKLGVPFLNMINQGVLPPSIPRFAEGGLIGQVAEMPIMQSGRDLGRVELNAGGESYSLLADPDQFDRLLKRTAAKFGRTHR